MAMNRQRRTANLNNIVTYDTLKNVTLLADLTIEGLTGAGFVKADANGLLSVDTGAYVPIPSQTGNGGKYLTTDGSNLSWGTVSTANIYNSDGTLTGNRIVTMGGNYLRHTGGIVSIFNSVGTEGILEINSSVNDGNASLQFYENPDGLNRAYGSIIRFVGNGNSLRFLEKSISIENEYHRQTAATSWFKSRLGVGNLQTFVQTEGPFDVYATPDGNGILGTLRRSGSGDVMLGFQQWGGAAYSIGAISGGGFGFFPGRYSGAAGTESARFTAAGRLLLGTTTESTYILDVNGTARVSGNTRINAIDNSSTSYALEIYNQGNSILCRLNNNGTQALFLGGAATIATKTFGADTNYYIGYAGGIAWNIYAGNTVYLWGTTNAGADRAIMAVQADFGVKIALGVTNTYTPSAILDVTSTTQGFLPPRMTNAQRTAIATPATGLMAYSTDATEGMYLKLSGGWQRLLTSADNATTGTGTTNYVAKFTGSTTVGNSQIFDNGTNVGIGTISPSQKLSVSGNAQVTHTYSHTTGSFTSGLTSYVLASTALSPSYTSGMFYGALNTSYQNEFEGSATIPNSVTMSSQLNRTTVKFVNANSTITMTQGGSGLRAIANQILQFTFDTAQTSCVVSHVAGSQILAPYYTGANNPTITNYYGLAINPSDEYSATLAVTNRWGVYQMGTSDNNWFAGKVIIGSTNTVGSSPLNVKGLPTSSAGLSSGDIWSNAGVLTVVP